MLARTELGYQSPLLREVGVPHLFTTRELDVGPLEEDGPELSERLRAGAGVAPKTPILAPRQVHGGAVLKVAADMDRLGVGDLPADGLWTAEPGAMLLVRTADCVPLLLASEDGQRVAAVHAGWRGLAAGVIPNALVAMGILPGRSPAGFCAAIGPCLSKDRFEVGPEVARAFRDADLGGAVYKARGDRSNIDLQAAASMQLERYGLARIDRADRCTWNSTDSSGEREFWSYRRDVTHGAMKTTGRLAAMVAPLGSRAPRG